MNPENVWVVFNAYKHAILHVYGYEFQAQDKCVWYWTSPEAPDICGYLKNCDAIEFMTLDSAIRDIKESGV
jgi:hypothetical protein